MEKLLMGVVGLLFIGLGVRAIVTRRAHIEIGDTDSSHCDGIPVRGPIAIVIGVLGVGAGVAIIAKFAL